MIVDRLNRNLKDLRISVTDRCNFRCSYCMPSEIYGNKYKFLARDKILSFEETTRLARLFLELGVKKIRLTGGEPLLRHELHLLVQMLAGLPDLQDLAMTSNGFLLTKYIDQLYDAGLQRLTVSLDTLDPELFKKLSARDIELNTVLTGLQKARALDFQRIKLNTVVQKGVNDHEIVQLARFARENGFIIRFVEYMDVGNLNDWQADEVVTAGEIVKRISKAFSIEPLEPNYRGEVANRYRYSDGNGEFGIIASVTKPFCGQCSRIRLSADGSLFTCLFAHQGTDIKRVLRNGATDAELLQVIRSLWQKRTDRYSEIRAADSSGLKAPKVEMYHIGG